LIGDIAGGTIKVGGGLESKQKHEAAKYKTLTFKDKKYFKTLDLGDVFYNNNGTSSLIPDISATNGIKIDTREREQGASISSNVNGQTLPGTEVELYRNGAFLGNKIVGEDGRYVFENILAAGGDNIRVKFFFTDGSIDEKNFKVADDNAQLLEKNESEVQLFSGEFNDIRFSLLNYRYGLSERISTSLKVGQVSENSNRQGIDNSINDRPFILSDVVSLPFKSLNVGAESLISEKDFDYLIKMNTTILDPNIINFQYRHAPSTSPLLVFRNSFEGTSWKINHGLNIWRFQVSDFYQKTETTRNSGLKITGFVTSNTNLFVDATRDIIINQSETEQIKGGFRYRLNDNTNIQFSRDWLEPSRAINLAFNVQGGLDTPWNAKIIYNKPDEGNASYTGQVSYTLSRRLTLQLLASDDKFGFQISYADLVSQKPGPKYNEDFGSGTVSGRILSPVDSKGNFFPIVDAIVTVDGRSTRTNENGYFELSGISPYRNVEFKVDPMGMDVSMAPKKAHEIMYFRPGTHIEYNPELINTVGLDGLIILSDGQALSPNMSIDVKQVDRDEILQSVFIESDGFFVIEGLGPGEYILEIVDSSKKIMTQTKRISVNEGDVWIKNVTWNLK